MKGLEVGRRRPTPGARENRPGGAEQRPAAAPAQPPVDMLVAAAPGADTQGPVAVLVVVVAAGLVGMQVAVDHLGDACCRRAVPMLVVVLRPTRAP